MTDKIATEAVWISIPKAATITNYTPAWLLEWAQNLLGQPESERAIQVRHEPTGYEFWLPDLVDYVAEYAAGRLNRKVEAIWVNPTEASEITGYSPTHLRKIGRETWNLPEDQRLIRIRKRSQGYDMWLPDLIEYIVEQGHGPHQKPRKRPYTITKSIAGLASEIMVDKVTTESVWVTVKEAAEITGYTPGWMAKWVRDMFGIPADDRPIQVREHAGRYELWLPDLVEYVAEYAAGRLNQPTVEEIWINTSEGAELTGYNRDYVNKLARDNWQVPEDERVIRVRRRAGRYDIWQPDLLRYMSDHGYGPIQKKRPSK
jgi:hypothetical protein